MLRDTYTYREALQALMVIATLFIIEKKIRPLKGQPIGIGTWIMVNSFCQLLCSSLKYKVDFYMFLWKDIQRKNYTKVQYVKYYPVYRGKAVCMNIYMRDMYVYTQDIYTCMHIA